MPIFIFEPDLYIEGKFCLHLERRLKMNTIIGIENEENFVKNLDNKKYDELTKHLQYFLHYLFPFIDANVKFHCFQTRNFCKPDICISHESEMRYVSLKYGECETVHNENIITFMILVMKLHLDIRIV